MTQPTPPDALASPGRLARVLCSACGSSFQTMQGLGGHARYKHGVLGMQRVRPGSPRTTMLATHEARTIDSLQPAAAHVDPPRSDPAFHLVQYRVASLAEATPARKPEPPTRPNDATIYKPPSQGPPAPPPSTEATPEPVSPPNPTPTLSPNPPVQPAPEGSRSTNPPASQPLLHAAQPVRSRNPDRASDATLLAALAAGGAALAALVASNRGARKSTPANLQTPTKPQPEPGATGIPWIDGVNGYWNGGIRTSHQRRRPFL